MFLDIICLFNDVSGQGNKGSLRAQGGNINVPNDVMECNSATDGVIITGQLCDDRVQLIDSCSTTGKQQQIE